MTAEKIPGTEAIYSVGKGNFGISPGTAYLISGEKNALIETGTSKSVPGIINDLNELGEKELDYIAVTHIHLDHAGGAGFLIKEFPKAKIIVHETGAYHLSNPSNLRESAEKAIGEPFEHYGEIELIPKEKILAITKEAEFHLGSGYKLKALDSTGHAPHHLCFYETKTRSLFPGDAAGMYFPENGELMETTPPPNFDLEKSLETLEKMQEIDSRRLLYTHTGWTEKSEENLRRYANILEDWVREIEKFQRNINNEEEIISKASKKELSEMEKSKIDKSFLEGMVKMNVRGVLSYLKQKDSS